MSPSPLTYLRHRRALTFASGTANVLFHAQIRLPHYMSTEVMSDPPPEANDNVFGDSIPTR